MSTQHDSESRFRLMADAAPVMMWLRDADQARTWFNFQWETFVGRPEGRSIAASWTESVHPDDLRGCLDILTAAFAAQQPFTMEYRLRRHDGAYRSIVDTGAPVHEASGRFSGFVGSSIDVTDRKDEDAAVAFLAAIVASSDDAIIAKDLNGVIRSVNAAAQRLFGYSAEELIGRPVRILIPGNRQHEEDLILSKIRRGERIDHFETVRIAKDGRLIDISLTVSPVRDRTGTIIGVSKVARDITEQKLAQAVIASERERIEVLRQSAAADRERLLEAERAARGEAERASRVKDEFVAMVSHELRTPLNAILGWAQLMARGRDNAVVIERGLDVIARNTRTQAQLIADLLDVSRIVSGKLRLNRQRVDLPRLLGEAVDAVAREAEVKGVAIAKLIDETAGPIAGDPARLQQVVWNLLSNAIKFTPAGGKIDVTLRAVGDGIVEIAVTDSGVGIRPDALPFVFERFHQADRSITRRFGGLGLGLAIVKHLVERHGGTVVAESGGEGKGTSFTIRLPIGDLSSVEVGAAPDAPQTGARIAIALGPLRVLLVEDEPDTMEYVQRLLEDHGAVVIAARSAAQALALFRRERPDVLVSDIGLPETDGYDLIQQVRAHQNGDGEPIPAIALTAYARGEDRARALHAGFDAYLAKPAEPADLLATVASLARKRVTPRGEGRPTEGR